MQIKPADKCRSFQTAERAEQEAVKFFESRGSEDQKHKVHWVVVPAKWNGSLDTATRWTVLVFLMTPDVTWMCRAVADHGWKVTA